MITLNDRKLVINQLVYKNGRELLEELIVYLGDNSKFVKNFLIERLPQIKLIKPEGTYLLWLDFNELGLSENELEELIITKAGLWFDRGTMFGAGREGFQRINIACPRLILEQALSQLEQAINGI